MKDASSVLELASLRLSKNYEKVIRKRAAGNVCKGLRPLARSIKQIFQTF